LLLSGRLNVLKAAPGNIYCYILTSTPHLIHHEANIWATEKYGLYMLILGTLVWGFGDLLN